MFQESAKVIRLFCWFYFGLQQLMSVSDCRNYMNDSFRTNVFVRYYPETIACACIYLAARQLQVSALL